MSSRIPQTQLTITVEGLAKTFGRERILRNFDHEFSANSSTAITGSNGSGKSTLLKLLSGMVVPDKGQINYFIDHQKVATEDVFRCISFCAPAQQLIEEFSLREMLRFHLKFCQFIPGLDLQSFMEIAYFSDDQHKKINLFSSGMKQRLKLALALFTDTPVLMLDEPTTNMDDHGVKWYKKQILKMVNQRLIIIASNQPHEYEFCNQQISIEDYKAH